LRVAQQEARMKRRHAERNARVSRGEGAEVGDVREVERVLAKHLRDGLAPALRIGEQQHPAAAGR
jgi:hypothetical protein